MDRLEVREVLQTVRFAAEYCDQEAQLADCERRLYDWESFTYAGNYLAAARLRLERLLHQEGGQHAQG